MPFISETWCQLAHQLQFILKDKWLCNRGLWIVRMTYSVNESTKPHSLVSSFQSSFSSQYPQLHPVSLCWREYCGSFIMSIMIIHILLLLMRAQGIYIGVIWDLQIRAKDFRGVSSLFDNALLSWEWNL